MSSKKKIVHPTTMYDEIDIPNHHFKRDSQGRHICPICGFVLGSGGGIMPICHTSTMEEISENTRKGIDILDRLCEIRA